MLHYQMIFKGLWVRGDRSGAHKDSGLTDPRSARNEQSQSTRGASAVEVSAFVSVPRKVVVPIWCQKWSPRHVTDIKRHHCLCFKLHFVDRGWGLLIPEVSKARLDGLWARDTLGCGDAHDPGMVVLDGLWDPFQAKPRCDSLILWFSDQQWVATKRCLAINNVWGRSGPWMTNTALPSQESCSHWEALFQPLSGNSFLCRKTFLNVWKSM